MTRHIFSYLALIAASLISRNLQAEVNGGESIDWIVANCSAIVRGTVSDVAVTKQKGGVYSERATFQVEEILKGKAPMNITFDVRHFGHIDAPSAWKKDNAEVLLFMVGDRSNLKLRSRWGRVSATRLNKNSKGVFTTDFRVLTKRDEILKAVKQAVSNGKGKEKPKGHSVDVPFGTEASSALFAGSSVYLVVPADEKLEATAKKWLKSEHFHYRLEGVNAMRHFKSGENAELLKSLLDDPGFYTVTSANKAPRKVYAVRKTAFEILTLWGVKVDRPTIEA